MSPLFIRFVGGVSACVMALSHGAAIADGPQFNFPTQRNQDAAQAAVRMPADGIGIGPENPPGFSARPAGKRVRPEGGV